MLISSLKKPYVYYAVKTQLRGTLNLPVKRSKNKDKAACDALASKITRSIGYCLHCGTTTGLTCSHIIKRKYSATRTDLDNLQSLCFSCHWRFENFPREFSHWITESIGSDKYEELRHKAESFKGSFDWYEERQRLKKIVKELYK